MTDEQRQELARLCRSVQWQAAMAPYSTFRTGGSVEALVEVSGAQELARLVGWLHSQRIPWQVIGGGSNILVTSRPHEDVFIRLRAPANRISTVAVENDREDDGKHLVWVDAGCSLGALVSWCARRGLSGLEFMAGIPGSVGGAIRMNAGAFGHAIGEVLSTVDFVTDQGELVSVDQEAICFDYRKTSFPGEPKRRVVIAEAVLCLHQDDREAVVARCREIVAQRRRKQPPGLGSAGSFFKNPEGDFAGRLIEQAGLKGLSQGKAMVSRKHANFIVNTGGAVPEDILALMEQVRQKVWLDSGVMLEPEVRIF
ncbi:MAG: UDP-N-acetylmuramate dehydrogenase [Desulfobulbus sp.]|jgi:UDP-N-acetylmuramate dehydrogenase